MAWNVANFIALTIVFLIAAAVSVCLRFWARTKTRVKFGLDDALIIASMICLVGQAVMMIVGTQIGNFAQHQKNKMSHHGPIWTTTLSNYEKVNYIIQLMSLASLGLSKTSVLIFYRRIFYVHSRFLVVNTILLVVVAAWAIAFFFTTVFMCRTPSTLWTKFAPARTHRVDIIPFYNAGSISGLVTDILILASPLPVLYKLLLPLKNRVAVAGIFLLGALVCGAGVARCTTFIDIGHGFRTHYMDMTYFTTPIFVWTMIETSLAIVGANLPHLRPLLSSKTYTSSYAWSFIRTITFRISNHSRRSRGSTESGGSSKVDIQLEEKLKQTPSYMVRTGVGSVELSRPPTRGVYVEHRYEVA